jgi:hypothetical protein
VAYVTPMRLRERVNQYTFGSSSSEDGGDDDDDWANASDEDGGDGGAAQQAPAVAVRRPVAATAATVPVLRSLTPLELSRALLDAQVANTEPRRVSPAELTTDWLRSGGFREPLVVACSPGVSSELEMLCPPEFTQAGATATDLASRLLDALGADFPVPNFDVETQVEQPAMPLAEFVRYFSQPWRDKLLNVVSLSLASTPLAGAVTAPRIVREADLVACCWPPEVAPRPEVQLYALCSPGGCYTDWHLDFGGSSVWYRIIAGSKVFMAAPPTEHNIRSFVRWASSSRQSREFLGNVLEDTHRFTARAGDLLLIPGGWPHAVFTPSDSFVVGGNFVHSTNLRTQNLVWRVEDRLSVAPSCRYPAFKSLSWYAAQWMCRRLPAAPDEDLQAAKEAARIYATRLSVKLHTASAAGDGGDLSDGAGTLHAILHALTSEDQMDQPAHAHTAHDDAPASGGDGDDGAEGEVALLSDPTGVEPHMHADDEPGAARSDAAQAAAPLQPLPPAADLAPTGPPLSDAELGELSGLYAQLRLWLAQAKNNERDAGAPFGMVMPRVMLARLKLRLRAAGQAIASIEDTFDESGVPRIRVRQRDQGQLEFVGGSELPAELGDEVEVDEPARKKKSSRAADSDSGPANKTAAASKPRAAPADVRSRLASKLKLGLKKSAIRR